ncbi:hypothetical protein SAMN02927895_00435 [Belnapia rosea]|uniref:Uncharacterized protein n=2 Tax=Belnapia rosea TaxID=938405 RepID=A0A1G6JR38_9PROT|nr:hypothetical protein SAMN02927895_00435 [Belnapia rosea]SDC21121.1 hypothetical protein SAMN04487779_1001250 [Belnapia rosea]
MDGARIARKGQVMTKSNRRPERRHGAAPVALLMAGVLLAAQPASALPRCASETDQTVFEVEALKTELMVVATTCKQEDRYNAFVQKYQPALAQNGRAFGQYFIRTHGGTRPGQRQNDIYITELANVRSNVARSLGSDFCMRNGGLFDEVMALQSVNDLPAYAAGKDLLSSGATACQGAPAHRAAAAPARRTAGTHTR